MNFSNLPAAEYLELEVDLVYTPADIDTVCVLVAESLDLVNDDRQALNARLDTQSAVFACRGVSA